MTLESMQVLIPESTPTADVLLGFSRSSVLAVEAGIDGVRVEIGATRIRLYGTEGRPLPKTVSLTLRSEGELIERSTVNAVTSDFATLEIAAEFDRRRYVETRRNYASVPGEIGRARRFFLEIELGTHARLCQQQRCVVVGDLTGILASNLHARWNGFNAFQTPETEMIRDITRVFAQAGSVFNGSLREEVLAYMRFAGGLLEHWSPSPPDVTAGPNSANLFLFAEFAFAAIATGDSNLTAYWSARLPACIMMQEVCHQRFGQTMSLGQFTHAHLRSLPSIPVTSEATIAEVRREWEPQICKDSEEACHRTLRRAISGL